MKWTAATIILLAASYATWHTRWPFLFLILAFFTFSAAVMDGEA